MKFSKTGTSQPPFLRKQQKEMLHLKEVIIQEKERYETHKVGDSRRKDGKKKFPGNDK